MTRVLVLALMAFTASPSESLLRATIATSAPEAANRVATASPIPLLPPVTMAERPERLISMTDSHDPRSGTASFLAIVRERPKGSSGPGTPAGDDAVDFLARRRARRLVVEQHLGLPF